MNKNKYFSYITNPTEVQMRWELGGGGILNNKAYSAQFPSSHFLSTLSIASEKTYRMLNYRKHRRFSSIILVKIFSDSPNSKLSDLSLNRSSSAIE
jgi:hypothetical protein